MNKVLGAEKVVVRHVEQLLSAMGIDFDSVEVVDDQIGIERINIVVGDAKLLIGPRGEHLQALNTLVKLVAKPDVQEDLSYIIDVNDYQRAQIDHLRDQTKIIAERVKLFNKDLPLPPMSAYERMIVHSVATTIDGIKTRSEGEGRERHVVICPKELAGL